MSDPNDPLYQAAEAEVEAVLSRRTDLLRDVTKPIAALEIETPPEIPNDHDEYGATDNKHFLEFMGAVQKILAATTPKSQTPQE